MGDQKRHFVSTHYAGHLGLAEDASQEDFIQASERLVAEIYEDDLCNYVCGQVELCPTTGRLHAQIYSEWSRSFRNAELGKRHSGSYYAAKKECASRTGGRNYCTSKTWDGKDKGQLHVLPTFGEWRNEKVTASVSLTKKAIHYLMEEGLSPPEIASLDPEVYFHHGRKICELYNMLRGNAEW